MILYTVSLGGEVGWSFVLFKTVVTGLLIPEGGGGGLLRKVWNQQPFVRNVKSQMIPQFDMYCAEESEYEKCLKIDHDGV